MRRSSLLLPAAALASALALGCGEQQPPTAPAADLSAPSFSATVIRGTEPFGFGFADGRSIVFVGLTVEDLTSIFCTGTSFDVDELNALTVTRPDGSFKTLLRGPNVNVVVVELASFEQSFCDSPLAVPTFTGTTRVLYTDNDVLVSGNRANASLVHIVGTVTDQSGQPYHLVAFTKQVLSKESTPDNFIPLNAVIKIRLTPIGG